MKNVIYFLLALVLPLHAQVLATVGNSKITVEDFKRRYEDVRKQALNPPTPEQFLEDLVRFEVGVQEAEKLNLQNDPAVKDRFKQVLYNALLEKQIGGRVGEIKISEKDLREFYKKNPELHLSHILIDLKDDARPVDREIARKRAMEILDDVKKSKKPFDELGNDIGFQSRLTLAPVMYDAAVNMKSGEIKGPIESRFGFHIVKLLERRNFDLADKHQLRAVLMEERRTKIFDDYFEKAKKGYKVDVNKEALKSATK